MLRRVGVLCCALVAAGCAEVPVSAPSARRSNDRNFKPTILADATPDGGTGDAMVFHGGPVLRSTVTYAIFWGPEWNTDTFFTGDKITTVSSFLGGFGGSYYALMLTEYAGTNGSITTSSSFQGAFVDNSPASNSLFGQVYADEACRVLDANGIAPRDDGVYVVYSSQATPPNPSGTGLVGGFHDSGTCHTTTIRVAVAFNADAIVPLTDGVYHSDNAAFLANTTAHELAEAITDPDGVSGWRADGGLGEVADKCNYTFGPPVTLSNGVQFKVQSLWSNIAYANNGGILNARSQSGCVTDINVTPGGTNYYPVHASGTVTASVLGCGAGCTIHFVRHYTSRSGSRITVDLGTYAGPNASRSISWIDGGLDSVDMTATRTSDGHQETATYFLTDQVSQSGGTCPPTQRVC